eukprot:CAMPEP_0113600824 /NCGR_PEP_ID=MMETSP0015_2-20120614/42906_1 /TAXON_ID=2838 /ORGANISM="Odontella" /LENGTH=69 /DNA_ID=CAMNT_0000509093 /DNA_START=183 /DNA_END=392 /DNA_ORIENTATION=- /assembly_acc=CAM_ASM_000160
MRVASQREVHDAVVPGACSSGSNRATVSGEKTANANERMALRLGAAKANAPSSRKTTSICRKMRMHANS